MKIELDTSDTMKINTTKEEIRKVYSSFDKFVMYHFIYDLLEIIGRMYQHIMSDEKEVEKEMSDE